MADLRFNIANVFSTTERSGALGQNNVTKYYIPPYQRGYKWKSTGQDAWVERLMRDLLDAFENKESEYYLQYITVKKKSIIDDFVFELIDGQQRITTLILLLSVIFYKNNNGPQAQNISYNKLVYGIRDQVQKFLEEFLFDNIVQILNNSWEDFVENNNLYDEQDIYYLFSAIKKIHELLPAELDDFNKYIKECVYLMINVVDARADGEKIFGNLNSNRVELTSTDLIKALLLTKASRDICHGEINYKELMELRSSMGRKWDEINRWVNKAEVKIFYFRESETPMSQFLTLIALNDNYDLIPPVGKFQLFDHFQTMIKRNVNTPNDYFKKIKLIYSLLKDWYNSNEIYNRMGYLFFTPKSSFNSTSLVNYFEKTKNECMEFLLSTALHIIPTEVTELEYSSDKDDLQKVLLALSIFGDDKNYRFNFYEFDKGSWSLEHIFPQTPAKLPDSLGKNDIALLNSLLIMPEVEIDFSLYTIAEETIFDIKNIYSNLIEKLRLDSCEINEREKTLLYQRIRSEKLNSIGNLVLLTGSDNSSNSNGMFDYKRMNIVSRVSNGSFVPKHTYDVFSKLISENLSQDLMVWNERDIEIHTNWINEKIINMKNRIFRNE